MINKQIKSYKHRIKELQRRNQLQYDIIRKLVISLSICEEQLTGLLKRDIQQQLIIL